MHFWGTRSNELNYKDVEYVAAAYEFWLKDEGMDGVFTATLGINAKDGAGNQSSIEQLIASRGMSVKSKKEVIWGHTIPNDNYQYKRDGMILRKMFYN